ncbi:hypothetical protein [Pyrodictium delaneyi]|uniref:Uncharacterized protein n=1 Tax=Pyrodictium delaneyi TaxID=1273541 RepID=A0A211YPG9_9CREN|nr:hypothetical protein [Pyrodictium delaneyi]OWJ54727.1 hypothetical protein Pdsh_03085 [Pyrodictium delaneyi]
MSRRNVVAVVAVLVVLAVLLAWDRPRAGGGAVPTPTISPPSAGTDAVTATGTPSSGVATVRLEGLDGALHALDGETLTRELWAKMRDYNAGDPAIAPYIEWLRKALAPDPSEALNVPWYPRYYYWWFNDREDWNAEPPSNDTIVRVGLIKLPFGAGLIVTAYQAGNHIDIVVHGTIINKTEWKTLLARSLMFHGVAPLAMVDYYGPDDFYTDVTYGFGDFRTDWALWRIRLDAHSRLAVGNTTLPVGNVYVLLEMPAYFYKPQDYQLRYLWGPEALYWEVVGYPAMSLALRLSSPPTATSWGLYTKVREITISVVTTATQHCWLEGPIREIPSDKLNPETPFLIRAQMCGVCKDYTAATALFASHALGAVPTMLIVDTSDLLDYPLHSVSVLTYLSATGMTGPVRVPADVDGDGVNETSVVISDTAELSIDYINTHIIDYDSSVVAPFRWYSLMSYLNVNNKTTFLLYVAGTYYWTGAIEAVAGFPDWMQMPWIRLLPESLRPEHGTDKYMDYLVKWWYEGPALHPRSGTPSKDPVEVVEYGLNKTWFSSGLPLAAPPDFWEKVFLTLLNKTMGVEDTVPPSVALALNRTIDSVPVVYEDRTPALREYLPQKLFQWRDMFSTPTNGDSGQGETNGQTHQRTVPVVNATIVLEPVYRVEAVPGEGEVLVVEGLSGTVTINGTDMTVVAVPMYGVWDGRYSVTVYVNGSKVYSTGYVALPATMEFTYNGVRYMVRVEPPLVPELNEALAVEDLAPMDTVPVPTRGGEVNVTIYSVNETITLDNVTVIVVGDAGRLGAHLDIMVYGVPPANYNATAVLVLPNGTEVPVDSLEAWYQGYLHITLGHDMPVDDEGYQQLLPEGTMLRIAIQLLNLTIEVPIT